MDSYAGENEPKVGSGVGSHVLLLPYPSQGHVHPMLQFGKRLAYYGLRPTLAVTRFILATCAPGDAAARRGAVRLAAVSDGFDRGGFGECGDVAAYLSRLEAAGSETLGELLEDEAARGRPVRAVVYDAFLPWAQGVARRHGARAAAFFTQPCAVNVAYGHVWRRRLRVPVDGVLRLPGLPALDPDGLPSFLKVGTGLYPAYFEMVVRQFQGLEQADDVLVNSFYELEPEVSCVLVRPCRCHACFPAVHRFQMYLSVGSVVPIPIRAVIKSVRIISFSQLAHHALARYRQNHTNLFSIKYKSQSSFSNENRIKKKVFKVIILVLLVSLFLSLFVFFSQLCLSNVTVQKVKTKKKHDYV
jgi:hypothetical protein